MRFRRSALMLATGLFVAMLIGSTRAVAGPLAQIALVSPQGLPVGTTVLATANGGAGNAALRFRYSVGAVGSPLSILRDFSPFRPFSWTPLEEGSYTIVLTARDTLTGETLESSVVYRVTSRVTGGQPLATGTQNPLVALYSAPPCSGTFRVRFRTSWPTVPWQYTPWKPCVAGKSVNQYIAGMAGLTEYLFQHEVNSGTEVVRGPVIPHFTGAVSSLVPAVDVLKPVGITSSIADGIVLHQVHIGRDFVWPVPFATDLQGRVIWYFDRVADSSHFGSYMVRPFNGTMGMVLKSGPNVGDTFREIDLAGNTVRETNIERIREQMLAMGVIDETYWVGAMHHELRRLANGHTLAIVSIEHVVDGVDFLGDGLVDLDENMQVVWAWNAFRHLPPPLTSLPTLLEFCSEPLDGCPTTVVFSDYAIDWTHTNSIELVEADGSLVVSMRNQDMLIKIDYQNGTGPGGLIWKLGARGDFTLVDAAGDPLPWFSHQHDATVDGDRILLYDNGNVRRVFFPGAQSRGQVWRIDEAKRTVALEYNVTLPVYAEAFGSAQKLSNGNYAFGSGFLPDGTSQSTEVTPSDGVSSNLRARGMSYRSYRTRSLYQF
jgi:hypothetical protein